MQSPVLPPDDIWSLLFDRLSLPFPKDHVIFRSATTDAARTYEEVRQQAIDFGGALKLRWSLKKGEVLVVMAANHIDTPAVVWGCHYAGGTVCPVNPTLSSQELHQQLVGSKACGLVVHSSCLDVALEGARTAGIPKSRILVLDADIPDSAFGLSSVQQFTAATLLGWEPTSFRMRTPVNPMEDIAYLVYSSGTTGRPKATMISHRNVVASMVMQSAVDGDNLNWRDSRSLAVLPVYHIYGLVCLVHLPMFRGITSVFMEKFDLEPFCRLVQDHSISHAYVAPPVVLHLTNSPLVDRYDMTSLRMLTSGGAPLAANLIKGLFNKRGIPVCQAYGLSETTATSHIQRWGLWNCGTGSNGPPLPGLETKFVKPDGSVAATGEEGELWIRGPTVFNGYRDAPDITAKSITEEGWFKTGDIGYEEDSNMFITDRAKDLIKFKGYQVAPAELEDLLIEHEAVKDSAVIGIMNHDLASEVPLAYIVLSDGKEPNAATAGSILEFVKSRTVQYKNLRGGIVFTDAIPKGGSGKILKRVLREKANGVDKDRRLGAAEYGKYKNTRSAKL